VIYGRRRVGKTSLIQRFFASHPGLYLVGRQESEKDQLLRISSQISQYFGDKLLEINPLQSWDAIFTYLFENHSDTRLCIDEFPYFVQSQPALPSILQEYWDKLFKKHKLYLILCGSSLSMMESLLGYESPIYGRRTHQLLLEALKFEEITPFMPSCSVQMRVIFYSIFGGTPAYLAQIHPNQSVEENIRTLIFPRTQFLYQDPLFLLREEVNEPRLYFSLLKSIATGHTKINEIVTDCGLDKSLVSKYLTVLQDLQIIERRVPITEAAPEKSRKGIYRLRDPFFCFWFRFIFPSSHLLEQNQDDYVLQDLVLPNLDRYVSFQFEEICAQWMKTQMPTYMVGRWWDKNHEVDLLAITPDKKHGIIAEIKWSDLDPIDGIRIFTTLEQVVTQIPLDGVQWHYYLFCRSVKPMKKKMDTLHHIITIDQF
jgi:AAA+ ATPase superfamily predicted ATPase